MATNQTTAWITAELDRVWLLGELRLCELQRAGLRPAAAEIDAIFAARRAARGGSEPDAALRELERQLPALRATGPLAAVAANLGLTELEREVLIVALAPHIDPPLADLFAAVRGTVQLRGVDLALVGHLRCSGRGERVALLQVLDPERPLLAWDIVRIAAADAPEAYRSAAHRSIQPSFELLALLCGQGEATAPGVELVRAPAMLDDLELDAELRARLAAICAARAARPGSPWPWVALWGPRGAGKRTLAARLAAYGDRPLLAFDPRGLDGKALHEAVRRAQRDALVRGAVLYLGPLGGKLLDDAGQGLEAMLRGYPGPIVLGIEAFAAPRLRLARPIDELAVAIAGEPTRLAVWRRALDGEQVGADVDLAVLARGFRLTPGETAEMAREAAAVASSRGRAIGHADLRAAVERGMRNELGQLARRVEVTAAWDDVVLPDDTVGRVRELIARARLGHRVYSEWGLGGRIGYGRGLIALLSGPPGTGKTMLAGLIARELDLDLYQVDLSQVVSKWVGETEKHLGQVFEQAERAHAVLLFDEADALFAKRTEVESSNDRYANLAVNYLLQRLEQYTGIAILTTNKDAVLDEALQRRLTLHVRFDVPEPPERERLWRSLLPRTARCHAIDVRGLAADYELTGGYIRNIVLRAAFLAAAHDDVLDEGLLRHAAVLELEDMGRVVTNGAWQ